MASRIYFSVLFCIITNPIMNTLWVLLYDLKFGWMLTLDFIFVVSCTIFLTCIEDIEKEIKTLKVSNENRVREIVKREIDNIKGKEKTYRARSLRFLFLKII